MGHVADTWERTVDGRRVRTDRYGAGRRWLARYEDLDCRARSKAFARKLDAERFLATVETDKHSGLRTTLTPTAAPRGQRPQRSISHGQGRNELSLSPRTPAVTGLSGRRD